MTITQAIRLVLKRPLPEIVVAELTSKVNDKLPEEDRLPLGALGDPMVLLTKLTTLSTSDQAEVLAWLSPVLQDLELEERKRQYGNNIKLIIVVLGLMIAYLATSVDASLITEEFIRVLMNAIISLLTTTMET